MENLIKKERSKLMQRWWVKSRPSGKFLYFDGKGNQPVIEFYTPWWGWPFELLHRLIFGYPKITNWRM